MINGDIEMFIDTLHFGQDIYLIFNNKRLFIDGWMENDVYTIRMFDYDSPQEKSIYNFEISGKDKEKVVDEFLNKKIWDGKVFFEAADLIEWSEPF